MRQNIYRASLVAAHLWAAGFPTICPHTNSAFMDGIAADNVWLEGYIRILELCDVVVFLPHENSEGSKAEHSRAVNLKKSVYEMDSVDPEDIDKLIRHLDVVAHVLG